MKVDREPFSYGNVNVEYQNSGFKLERCSYSRVRFTYDISVMNLGRVIINYKTTIKDTYDFSIE